MKRREAQRGPSTVVGLLADANRVLRQNGLTLAQSGQTRFADKDAWLNPSTATAAAEYDFDELMDSSANTGGVELYFVQTITSAQGTASRGVRRAKGIAIASSGDALTVAHEVLHACGLADIYPKLSQTVFLTEESTFERLPSDWCGGYYEPGQLQRYLVGRLLMSPQYSNVLPRGDAPSGPIWGWGVHVVQGAITYELELVPVGQSAMQPLTPSE